MTTYPRLFSEWQIGKTTIKNRIVFPPTCPSWVSDPWNGLFTDMATAYYAERAKGGVGLIIIGATRRSGPGRLLRGAELPQSPRREGPGRGRQAGVLLEGRPDDR